MIDSHVHLSPTGKWPYKSLDASERRLYRELNEADVGHAFLLPVPTLQSNDWARAVADKSSGRLRAFHAIDPLQDSPDDLARKAREQGTVGFKFHPRIQGLAVDDRRILDFFTTLADNCRALVIVDAFFSDEDDDPAPAISRFLDAAEGLKTVLAHSGGFHFSSVAPLAERPDVYLDTSYAPNVFVKHGRQDLLDDLGEAWRSVGPEKILFGSDFPECSVPHSLKVVVSILQCTLSDPEARLVFEGNAQRLLRELGA